MAISFARKERVRRLARMGLALDTIAERVGLSTRQVKHLMYKVHMVQLGQYRRGETDEALDIIRRIDRMLKEAAEVRRSINRRNGRSR